jgi:hypothetical protein
MRKLVQDIDISLICTAFSKKQIPGSFAARRPSIDGIIRAGESEKSRPGILLFQLFYHKRRRLGRAPADPAAHACAGKTWLPGCRRNKKHLSFPGLAAEPGNDRIFFIFARQMPQNS